MIDNLLTPSNIECRTSSTSPNNFLNALLPLPITCKVLSPLGNSFSNVSVWYLFNKEYLGIIF